MAREKGDGKEPRERRRDYPYIPNSFFRQEYFLSHAREYIETFAYALVSFSIPFLFLHEQLFVGTAVNAALILAALNIRGIRLLPIIVLPSLALLIGGVAFGTDTSLLVRMMPFIWLGNAALVYCIKEFYLEKKKSKWVSLGIGATAKAGFLFASAFALFSFGLLPALFLASMGIYQFITAITGGIVAFGIQEAKKKFA